MDLEKILNLLPLEITEDEYFQNLYAIVINNFTSVDQLIFKIQVNYDIYKKLDDRNMVFVHDSDTLISFKYLLKDSICSFAVKNSGESFYVYFEVKSFNKMARTILIKGSFGVIVETKETLKEDGVFRNYNSNVYYYDTDYNKIDFGTDEVLDKMFSDDFGIPCDRARIMRKNFSKYAKFLSILYSEQKMKSCDGKLSDIDFLHFRSPWLVSEIKGFIKEEYDYLRKNAVRKYFNKSANSSSINIHSVHRITDWIQNNLDGESEMVISDNIFGNLVPLLAGEDADGYDTKGLIVEKRGEEYILYQVHFITNKIYSVKDLINKEQAQELFKANSKNLEVEGLSEFFGITRGR